MLNDIDKKEVIDLFKEDLEGNCEFVFGNRTVEDTTTVVFGVLRGDETLFVKLTVVRDDDSITINDTGDEGKDENGYPVPIYKW